MDVGLSESGANGPAKVRSILGILPLSLESIVVPRSPAIEQIPRLIRRVRFAPPVVPCDRCQEPARSVWTVTRTAIDIDQPVLLAVEVSVHHCAACHHDLRAQPPFLPPNAIDANRVVQKATEAVFHDDLAIRRVAARVARDFWVRPSAKMIRAWCRTYAPGVDFERDDLPGVVETFSGVLGVDEVYQDKLALLLAVDPGAPEGDRRSGHDNRVPDPPEGCGR